MKYLGKIAGAGIGLIAGFGIFGVILGIILGHLADQLIGLYRIRKRLAWFYHDPSSFPLDASEAKTAGMVGLFRSLWPSEKGQSLGPDSLQYALMKQYIIDAFRTLPGIPVIFLNLCAEASTRAADPAGAADLARVYRSVTGMEERKSFLQFLLLSFPDPESIRPLCILLNIEESWFTETAAVYRPDRTSFREDCMLLGVTPEAGTGEIKRVYRRLAAQFHPDSGSSLQPEQQKQLNDAFIRIHGAYLRILKEKAK